MVSASKVKVKKVDPFDKCTDLLTEFGHLNNGRNGRGMKRIERTYYENKMSFIKMFEDAEGYNGNLQIVMPMVLKRKVDSYRVRLFYTWAREECRNLPDENLGKWGREMINIVLHPLMDGWGEEFTSITSEIAEEWEKVNDEFYPNIPKMRIVPGTAVSRVVNKIANVIGINKIKDMQNVSWHDQDGNYHERLKDMGWNHWFNSVLSDAINPYGKEVTAVLSINPYDYYTMSFGTEWASCHTIDKKNVRKVRKTYSGCYCAGTETYLLDKTTMIFYLVNKKYEEMDINHPEDYDKFKRAVVYMNNETFAMSRVYPDGRDGGDPGVRECCLGMVKKIMANLMKVEETEFKSVPEDEWSYLFYTEDGSQNYADYDDCKDVDVFYASEYPENFYVGGETYCPDCGDILEDSSYLLCEYCREYSYKCDCCGNRVREYEVLFSYDNTYCYNCAAVCNSCEGAYLYDDLTNVTNRTSWGSTYVETYCEDCLEELGGLIRINDTIYLRENVRVSGNGNPDAWWNLMCQCHECGHFYATEEEAKKCTHEDIDEDSILSEYEFFNN